MRPRALACLAYAVLGLAACGDDDAPARPDAAADAAVEAGLPDGGVVPMERAVVPPTAPNIPWWNAATGEVTLPVALPMLTPCAAGWSEVHDADATYCEPWPAGGGDCPGDDVRFPGDASCAPLGPACPAGRFPADLPAGRPVIYVDASSPAGGTGTAASPYRDLAAAVLAERATPNVVFAVAPGVYDGATVSLRAGNALIGACASGVDIRSSTAAGTDPVVFASGAGIEVRNVRVSSPVRKGFFLRGATIRLENVLVERVLEGGIGADTASRLTARNLVVRDVIATSSRFGGGVVLRGSSQADLERVVLEDLPSTGVLAFDGGSFTIRDAVVRRLAGNSTEGLGVGLASIGNTFEAERIVAEDNHVIAVRADSGATGRVSRSLLRDNLATDTTETRQAMASTATLELHAVAITGCNDACVLSYGAGSTVVADDLVAIDGDAAVLAFEGGTATVTRLYAARVKSGVLTYHGGSSATVSDAFFRETGGRAPTAGFGLGRAVEAQDGTSITVERLRCVDSVASCAGTAGAGASLSLSDAWISGTRPLLPYTNDARAIGVEGGSTVTLRRALVETSQDHSLLVFMGGQLDAEDLVIRDSVADGSHPTPSGWGLVLYRSASARVARARVERVQEFGVAVEQDSTLEAEDLAVYDVRPEVATDLKGIGVFTFPPAVIRATRLEVRGALDTGVVLAGPGVDLDGSEVGVYDIEGEVAGGILGRGIEVSYGAHLRLIGAVIRNARDLGIGLFENGTTAELERITVLDTRARACADASCADAPGGTALGAYAGASATVRDLLLRGSALCGVQLAGDAALDLADGVVERNDIGACVQVDGYDLGRLSSGVVYRDNGRNLDAPTLPVPDPRPLATDPTM